MFFPNAAFAWVFCLALILLTGVAAWTDTRKAIVPNRLCILILILGLLASAIRGGWLAGESHRVWQLVGDEGGAVWLGVIDGLLFALVGFLLAFAVMFGLWIFGLCGGGDVKLVAAIAAWTGFWYCTIILFASVMTLLVWMIGQLVVGGLSAKRLRKTMNRLAKPKRDPKTGGPLVPKGGKMRTTFSLPVAVATAAVLLFIFRVELQLVPPKPQQPQPEQPQGAAAHVRSSPLPS